MDTKRWLLTGMFLLGPVAWALFGSEMPAAIGVVLVVALALLLAFIALACIAAVGAQREQAAEDERRRDDQV